MYTIHIDIILWVLNGKFKLFLISYSKSFTCFKQEILYYFKIE